MRKLMVTIVLIAIVAVLGCGKQPASSTDQSATPNAPTAAQTQDQPAAASVPPQTEKAPDAAPAPKPEPPKPEPPKPLVVPAGSTVTVRTTQALSSKDSKAGEIFTAIVDSPVSAGGKVAIPAGSSAQGAVVTAKAKGKVKGEAVLELQLTQITIKGQAYPIQTSVLSQTEKGKGKRTAKATGGGAAAGALIGAIAGGGKGAAIGAGIGAGAGLVGGAATGNKQIELPAESALAFTLTEGLTIEP